jgi:predicted murein hydrolase (TIGR00659 family)
MTGIMEVLEQWFRVWFFPYAVVGLAATILLYVFSLRLSARWPWLHPVFIPSLGLIAAIVVFRIPREAYEAGGKLLTVWLGPSTVALAVPVYKHARMIRKHLAAVCMGVVTGTLSAALVSAALMLLWTRDADLIWSVAVKSVTSPISMELSRALGGIPELTASVTVLTGLIGSWTGRRLLSLFRVRNEEAVGVAIGTTAHGIGTGRLMRDSEYAGSFSTISMGLAGIFLSLVTAAAVLLFGL